MTCTSCKIFVKGICNVIISLGMFVAIMAFHLLSFVACLLLSCGIVFGLSLTYHYCLGKHLPIYIDNFIILSLLSYLSKFHLVFYYKVIYPGDNYDRSCWSFLKKVTKLIYAMAALLAFTRIYRLHLRNSESVWISSGQRSIMGILSILVLWDENKNFLICMAILVHLFSVSLTKPYKILCKRVPAFNWKCFLAIGYSLVHQTMYTVVYFFEFYFVHSWIPLPWVKEYSILYSVLTGISLLFWVIQVTFCELFADKLCSLTEKNKGPYFWYQNITRGRILVLKYVFLPLTIWLFYWDYDSDLLKQVLSKAGIIGHAGVSNPGLIFLAFFSATSLHALKSLMLLKNGLSRLMYSGWICYFCFYDLITFGCCEDDLDDFSDISSGSVAVSDITADENGSNRSTQHDSGRRGNNPGPPPCAGKGEHFGDDGSRNSRKEGEPDSVEDVHKEFARVKNGIGDHNNNLVAPGVLKVLSVLSPSNVECIPTPISKIVIK
ncbi:unnamed protein product [Allacma fusca]|uniref:Uncharacterized protein n=1 Tax=Allacma fusca TaxID=39272 RepID=A0A8J2PJP8_9HEXA|nr:unnamed protein product [Allacma fusca]